MIDLRQGDCLELMKEIPDKSIDMILCDLPYGTTACKWDNIIPFEPLWEQYKRIIKANGAIVLFGSEPFASKLRLSNIKMYRYDWIWDKTRGTNFQNAHKMPMKSYENICVFYKKLPTYNPQMTEGRPYKTSAGFRKNTIESLSERILSDFEKSDLNNITNRSAIASVYRSETINNGVRFPLSILSYKKDCKLHPNAKPISLLEYLIKTYTNENEMVLDNCAGSGSAGVACINTNRNFIGIELDEKYFNIAKERIYKAQHEDKGEE